MSSSKSNEQSQPRRGELFLVATPIGNRKDITLRALEVLGSVDRIACEDTRVSGGLLAHYGIKVPLLACHAHNEASATATLLAQLQEGARIALISDAGTPLLSDPGARLVRAAIAAGIRVTPIPGASALLSAISIAGLPADQFFYAGFLPNKAGARRDAIHALATLPATLVFYEAPHRLADTLSALHRQLGNRAAAVARELTKLYEECVRGSLEEIIAHFAAHPPRGECVIVVAGAAPACGFDDAALDVALRAAMTQGSLKEAVAEVSRQAGRPRREVYARALQLKDAP
ncbi:MAG: 16S rRNA (cytidine(1402)-2'-O)-methyltransferase [Alphaproteobacteria bacterium]|nr:16S rRNA (cytidine(1402)-2'-O)-methyltransferase [Alphaproteobacteria bacterium]